MMLSAARSPILSLLLLGACIDTGYSPFGEDAFEVSDRDNDGFPDDDDCAPDDVLSNPDSVEICDGIDNDCDGSIDEDAVNGDLFFVDGDGDGYGNPDQTASLCSLQVGYADYPGDCDDRDPDIHSDAEEVCDGLDNDCDDLVDEAATDASAWYPDSDSDGYGFPYGSIRACQAPAGYVDSDTDCDDTDGTVNPDAQEVCDADSVDEDCDGRHNDADSDTEGMTTWYYDADGDGYGTESLYYDACEQPAHFTSRSGDCDDSNASRYPGQGC